MLDRRSVLAGVGTLSLGALSGCLGLITGEDIEYDASPARVPDDALEETGYALEDQDSMVVEETFEVAGQSRNVVVTNWMTEYQKSVDMGPLGEQESAVFTCLTTPQVSVLGREFNPVSDMSTREIAEMVQDQYDDLSNLELVEEGGAVTVHGTDTTQDVYRGDGTFAGQSVELYLHISSPVEMGDDFLITVGGYPEMTAGEEDNILRLMESVEPDE